MGVPSWESLAKKVYEIVNQSCLKCDKETYEKYIQERKFPQLFELAEQDLGSYDKLIDTIRPLLVAKRSTGNIYEYLAKWPFACYFTTNFDDHLKEHLNPAGVYFETLRNTEEDFKKIGSDAANIIVKLHGDFSDSKNMVLTSQQYEKYRTGPDKEYFRRKLGAIFEMFPVLIVGYSLTDPDIELILSQAKHYSSPARPIYMILADVTPAEVNQYYTHKNIRIIRYDNPDGAHKQLARRVLNMMDRFIAPRTRGSEPADLFEEPPPELTSSLFVFTKTRLSDASQGLVTDIYKSLVLTTLNQMPEQKVSSYEALSSAFTIESLRKDYDPYSLRDSLENLVTTGMISGDTARGEVALTTKGKEHVEHVNADRALLKAQFIGQVKLDFKKRVPAKQ
jgi:hypothetical protein